MRTMKITTILMLTLIVFSACKKVEGPKGEKGDSGPDAKTFNFDLTFTTTSTFQSFAGITGFDDGDVILTFVKYDVTGGQSFWVQTPLILNGQINVFAEFSDQSGLLFVNTVKADGSAGSPWSSNTALAFKAVLIKSSGLIKNPNLDLSNYEEIKKTFNL